MHRWTEGLESREMGEEGLTGRRKVKESDERGSGRQSDEITEGVIGQGVEGQKFRGKGGRKTTMEKW